MEAQLRIQIAGHAGMLGRQVWKAAVERGHQALSLDVMIQDANARNITGEVLINCAGIVRQRPESRASFISSNSLGPHRLAECCTDAGARLLHMSTDCVFGLTDGPHTENSIPTPEDLYSTSKLLGEVTYDNHLTVRGSFVGHGGWGLVHQILAGEKVRASGRFLWNGMTAWNMAWHLVLLAEAGLTGLYHVASKQVVDRYSLVMMIASALGTEALVEREDRYWRDRRLATDRAMLPDLPPLADQLREMAAERVLA